MRRRRKANKTNPVNLFYARFAPFGGYEFFRVFRGFKNSVLPLRSLCSLRLKSGGHVENLTAPAILFRVGTVKLNQTNRITKKVAL
jgi:hypothetical protein